jgi:DNA-binding protein Fis
MELANGVKARAAALLSIKRTTLVEKIKRLNLES